MLFEKAESFINHMHQELEFDPSAAHERIKEIEDEISETGTYTHTTEELIFGAKTAWRHSNRCIGRLFWNNLEVRDLRHIDDEASFIQSIEKHIDDTTNNGKIKPMISIFSNDIKIYNEQLIRYAGYSEAGDPQSAETTNLAGHIGWHSTPDDFNILPLIYKFHHSPVTYHELNNSIIKEVPIKHDGYPDLESLNLKWYAVPVISNMDLEIGGLYYNTAPFNGWYMETEIGVRNFTDEYRYNKLREIAESFNLDTSSTTTYWRDRALVEFNYAVYHSFKNEGVSIVDHITASKQFKQFERQELREDRKVTGKWSWLAPPLSPSLVHNYHQGYDNTMRSPNFLYRKNENKCPFH